MESNEGREKRESEREKRDLHMRCAQEMYLIKYESKSNNILRAVIFCFLLRVQINTNRDLLKTLHLLY